MATNQLASMPISPHDEELSLEDRLILFGLLDLVITFLIRGKIYEEIEESEGGLKNG
jgi:hypothetical protein